MIGLPVERKSKSKKKKPDYPTNLIQAIDIGLSSVSKDQEAGLEYAIRYDYFYPVDDAETDKKYIKE